MRTCVAPIAFLTLVLAGCGGTFPIEHRMPPLLIPADASPRTISVEMFEAEPETDPAMGQLATRILTNRIANSPHYELAARPRAGTMVLGGRVRCRITDEQAVRPEQDGEPVQAVAADVAVAIAGATEAGDLLFSVVVRPTAADRDRLARYATDPELLGEELVRACIETFIADISPRPVAVRGHTPGPLSGRGRTRRAIRKLKEDPAAAVVELTEAVEKNPDDAAAWNALGFLSEAAGDLEAAGECYLRAIDARPRDAYRSNFERVRALIDRRDAMQLDGE